MNTLVLFQQCMSMLCHAPCMQGMSAVHVAAFLGDVRMLTGLVNRNADIDMPDNAGQVPLVIAAQVSISVLDCVPAVGSSTIHTACMLLCMIV